jgi:hypothetical protein
MKGDRKRKRNGFKTGHTDYYTKEASEDIQESVEKSVCYLRLPKDQHELVSEAGPGVEVITSLDQGAKDYRLLRPRGSRQSELEVASERTNERYLIFCKISNNYVNIYCLYVLQKRG